MPTRKFRRSIDHRVSSLSREMAAMASAHPALQDALTSLALNACMLSLNTQALVASCKATSDIFAEKLKDSGSAVAKSREVFTSLAHNVLKSGDGAFIETLETLVAIATESLPPDQRLRTLSNIAVSSGLDDSQIALDYQEQETHELSEPKAKGRQQEERDTNIDYNAVAIDAFTEVAAVRGLDSIRIEQDGSTWFLSGSDGRGWFRLVPLRCTKEEAERVAEGVRNRIRKRISR